MKINHIGCIILMIFAIGMTTCFAGIVNAKECIPLTLTYYLLSDIPLKTDDNNATPHGYQGFVLTSDQWDGLCSVVSAKLTLKVKNSGMTAATFDSEISNFGENHNFSVDSVSIPGGGVVTRSTEITDSALDFLGQTMKDDGSGAFGGEGSSNQLKILKDGSKLEVTIHYCVPEPATVASLLFGTIGILAKRKLLRKK